MTEFEIQDISSDPEISARLMQQALSLIHQLQIDGRKDKFLEHIMDASTKFHALKYHRMNYEAMERDHIAESISSYKSDPSRVLSARELLFELEAFLFQLKSALDLSIKLFEDLFPGRFKTHTFGDKGENLIKGLKALANDKNAKTETIDNLIRLIKSDKESWLADTIAMRDTVSHYRTFTKYCYRVRPENGDLKVLKPLIGETEVLEFMVIMYSNCLEFIQDLMCLAIELWLPPMLVLKAVDNSSEPSPQKYLKYALAMEETPGAGAA